MASKIKIKRSAVAGKVPLTTDLELSELAVNTNDGRLYTKKDDGTESIVEIGGPDFGGRNVTTTGTSTAASFIPTSSTAPTNGVYLPAANSVALSTNGTGRLFIDSSGKVGLGVGSPAVNLDVQGSNGVGLDVRGRSSDGATSLRLRNNASTISNAYISSSDTAAEIGSYSYLAFATGTSGLERLRITSAGLVGVGTSSPSSRFNISSANNDFASGFLQDGATTGYSVIQIKNTSGNTLIGVNGSTVGLVATNADAYSTVVGTFNSTNLHLITNDIVRATVDTSGRVGINTTSPTESLHVNGNARANSFLSQGYFAGQGNLTTADSRSGLTGLGPSSGSTPGDFYGGYGYFFGATHNTRPGDIEFGTGLNTAGSIQFKTNGTERFRCDNSGRLLVGTSTSTNNSRLQQKLAIVHAGQGTYPGIGLTAYAGGGGSPFIDFNSSRGTTDGSMTVLSSGDPLGYLVFRGADGTNFVNGAEITAYVDGTPGANDMPGRLVFSTTADGASSPTERMRIQNGGWFKASNTGSYAAPTVGNHEFVSDNNQATLMVSSTNSTTLTTGGVLTIQGGRATTDGTYRLLNAYNSTVSGQFFVLDNGNVRNTNNSYGAISDAKLKENIIDASSQWSDIKALQVRKYNFKEGQTHTQIGLIAQEVELVSPGLVSESPDRDEDGNDLGTVTKSVNYSVLYMKAVKALQEAMERIETLESEMAAVKAQLT